MFFCVGTDWCLFFWHCNVGNSHRRGSIWWHALWRSDRYAYVKMKPSFWTRTQHLCYEWFAWCKFKIWTFKATWCPTGHNHSIQCIDSSYWFHTTRGFLKVFICHLLSHFIDYWCSHYHKTKGITYIHYIISIKPEWRINTPSYKFPLTPFYISLDWEAQVGEMLCLDQFDFQNHQSYHKELPGNIFVWVVNGAKDGLDYVLVFRSQLTSQFQA
jgi:hypothetical protein